MLARLVYHSENHLGPFDGKMIGSLNSIMNVANRRNEKDGITGALLFNSVWFVQILEGDREAISNTLRRIMHDERHDNVTIMDTRAVPDRLFGNWWMGAAGLHGDNKALLARHGLGERLDPRVMTGDQAVALAVDLARQGLARQLSASAAA
jgi:hypothetical protein